MALRNRYPKSRWYRPGKSVSNSDIGFYPSNVPGRGGRSPTNALAVRAFRIYFVGTILAMNALRLGAVAQGLLMWELKGSTLSLGGVAAATAIPMVLVNIFGGVFSDRMKPNFFLEGHPDRAFFWLF
ncbi:MAG: hypothetical protein Ct9H300mP19_20230 [Dehalococcoidia bacterium]|nr:MAG: hypothetical protein Ct9H300mP19_20230 [Dehalococcoidia bacterium]